MRSRTREVAALDSIEPLGVEELPGDVGDVAMLAVHFVVHLAHFRIVNFAAQFQKGRAMLRDTARARQRRTIGTASYGGK